MLPVKTIQTSTQFILKHTHPFIRVHVYTHSKCCVSKNRFSLFPNEHCNTNQTPAHHSPPSPHNTPLPTGTRLTTHHSPQALASQHTTPHRHSPHNTPLPTGTHITTHHSPPALASQHTTPHRHSPHNTPLPTGTRLTTHHSPPALA